MPAPSTERKGKKKGHSLSSASASPNNPTIVALNTSGLCVAAACSQYCEKNSSSALARRGCFLSAAAASDSARPHRARMMGSVLAGKSGGRPGVMGTEKWRAHRRRSVLIQVSLSVCVRGVLVTGCCVGGGGMEIDEDVLLILMGAVLPHCGKTGVVT